MPLVVSMKKVCRMVCPVRSITCYSPLDKQSIAKFGKTTGESPSFPTVFAHFARWGTWGCLQTSCLLHAQEFHVTGDVLVFIVNSALLHS